jgi:hypothetical protein
MCPFCRSAAPVVHRGVLAYCTTCNRLRGPVTSRSVTIAGKPSQVGGAVATVLGYIVLGVGLSFALLCGLMLAWLFPHTLAPWAVSLPVALLTLTIWAVSHFGGKKLSASGRDTERKIREEAVYAMAHAARGTLRAEDVARAFDISVRDSDALLTAMAKQQPDEMAVDIDDHGELRFRFTRIDLDYRIRVEEARVENKPAPPPPELGANRNPTTLEDIAEYARQHVERAPNRH